MRVEDTSTEFGSSQVMVMVEIVMGVIAIMSMTMVMVVMVVMVMVVLVLRAAVRLLIQYSNYTIIINAN